jgi:hypothetical protein
MNADISGMNLNQKDYERERETERWKELPQDHIVCQALVLLRAGCSKERFS